MEQRQSKGRRWNLYYIFLEDREQHCMTADRAHFIWENIQKLACDKASACGTIEQE